MVGITNMKAFVKHKHKENLTSLIQKRDEAFKRYEECFSKYHSNVATFYYKRYLRYCESIKKMKEVSHA